MRKSTQTIEACLVYAEEKGYTKFIEEKDDGEIYNYCPPQL